MAPKFDFARRLGAALALVASQESPSMPLSEIEALRLGTPFTVPSVPRGLAVIVSDLWDEGLRPQLLRLRAETAVIHVLSPEELDPPLSGKLKLVDAETGETSSASWGRRSAPATGAARRPLRGLEEVVLRPRDELSRCASSTPLEEIVQVYLREAGVLE